MIGRNCDAYYASDRLKLSPYLLHRHRNNISFDIKSEMYLNTKCTFHIYKSARYSIHTAIRTQQICRLPLLSTAFNIMDDMNTRKIKLYNKYRL